MSSHTSQTASLGRRLTESAEDASERLASAIDAADIGVFFCPMPMREIIWNAKCKEHFWLPPDTEIDFDLFDSLLHPEDRERTRLAVEAAIFEGIPYDIEYRTISPMGDVRWVRAKGSTRYDAVGNPTRFDGITIDISAQKRLEADRDSLLERERLQRQEAQHASEVKDTLIATVSHELRAPLATILAWVDLLDIKATDPEVVKNGLNVMRRNVAAQTRLVDDLLDLSRISTGKLTVDRRPVSLVELVRLELAEMQPLAEKKGITVAENMTTGLTVSGDPAKLRQVFANLLGNALKYTPRGGRITVSAQAGRGRVELSVTDTGEGIPSQSLNSIFEPFAQIDGSTTRRHGGLGLGLSIAKSIVGMHGGTIRAFSEGAGKGATLTVTLPCVDIETADRRAADFQNTFSDTLPPVAGKSVLIVDDDRDALDAFARVFEAAQVKVSIAVSASAARDILAAGSVDAIFSDISMPAEDGYQFIMGLRAMGDKTPAIAVTAFARDEDRHRALAAGFDEHVGKPVHPGLLLALLAKLTAIA